jgi:hypothetical protein
MPLNLLNFHNRYNVLTELTDEKRTIRIILGLLFPGIGHIYMGQKKEQYRGIKIAIAFVLIAYFGYLLEPLRFGIPFLDVRAIVIVGFWLWQIRDLMKITEKEYLSDQIRK